MTRSLGVAFCLLVTLDVGGAFAQSPQPLDILGVQLRIPRESAVQSLLSRRPPYSVTNTVALTVEDLGPSIWQIDLQSPPDMLYGSGDTIVLDFAPPPTESRVLRIYRTVCYNCGVSGKTNPNAPSVGNFVGSLAEKLKSPTPTVVVTRDRRGMFETTVYVWTRAGEFLSSSELNRRLRYPARCINPPTLNAARANAALAVGGITVGTNFNLYLDDKNFEDTCGTVMQVAWTQEGGIIKHFDMNLSDVAGLVLAFSKSAALIDAKKGSQHQQELERAKQNRPKF